MKIIPGKILKEMLTVFLLIQVVFTLFFLVMGMAVKGVFDKIPISDLPFVIPYIFPFSQSLAGQFVVLFTVIIVYTRINTSREIIALQSSGISSLRIMIPAFILGLVMSFFSYFMSESHNSWGKYGMTRVISTYAENIFYNTLKTEKSFSYKQYSVNVKGVEGKKLLYPVCISRDVSEMVLFSAESARVEIGAAKDVWNPNDEQNNLLGTAYNPSDEEETIVKLTFERVSTQMDEIRTTIPGTQVAYIPASEFPIGKLLQEGRDDYPPSMPYDKLKTFAQERRGRIEELKKKIALQTTQRLILGDLAAFGDSQWNPLYQEMEQNEYLIKRANIEPCRRWALGFNCFFLAWVCTPLALWKGKHGALLLCATTIAPLLLMYYPAFMVLLNLVKRNLAVDPMVLWLPNLILGVVGFFLIRRAM
ncbi:MAG: LptF/LptG family permease [Planctomycetia bacterium]|nr:LptF/LptG family permease [Planctomycetia bacterium]